MLAQRCFTEDVEAVLFSQGYAVELAISTEDDDDGCIIDQAAINIFEPGPELTYDEIQARHPALKGTTLDFRVWKILRAWGYILLDVLENAEQNESFLPVNEGSTPSDPI